MVKCSFSGVEIAPGKGIMYIKKDGKVYHFAGRKEEKNMIQLGRKPRVTKWTQEFHDEKQARNEQSKQ